MFKNKLKLNQAAPHKIATYIRVSTEEQAENPEGSIRNQEERLKAAVKLKNMEGPFGEIVEVFIDRARSGKNTNRPELQRMLNAIRKKEITLVMVTELSRLSRSIKDFSEIWEMMRAQECGFHSLRENFDTTTAAGEMVLYTVANIAQFERRQVSERVSANFQARAERGLYNGGVLPLGYKLIPEKSGYLAIDEEPARTVQAAFHAFLKEGTLSTTAKWLNKNGFKLKREIQGGYHRPRLGHFTVGNLHQILKNRSYLGIRKYKVRGEIKETKANWDAIIDIEIFEKVQSILKENHCKKKSPSQNRYPYQLTGLIRCHTCNERLVGKSAHGNGGKIPYYEHGISMKQQGCLEKKTHKCKPFRVLAKKLEPALWEKVSQVLEHPTVAKEIIQAAHELYKKRTKNPDSNKIEDKIKGIESQIEVLAERLSELPKSVSATPIYRQMEKLENAKQEEKQRLLTFKTENPEIHLPIALSSYQSFINSLKTFQSGPQKEVAQEKIIRAMIHQIRITPEGFKAAFYVGKDIIETEQAKMACSSSSISEIKKFLPVSGSTSLTNGGP